jgi:uncharacterized integral membrane protein
MLYLILGYWSLVVIFFAFATVAMLDSTRFNFLDLAVAMALAVFWPATVVAGAVILVYSNSVKSVQQIRNDLRNRKILREFEEWLKTKES